MVTCLSTQSHHTDFRPREYNVKVRIYTLQPDVQLVLQPVCRNILNIHSITRHIVYAVHTAAML